MSQLQEIIDKIADLRKSTFFAEDKGLAVGVLGQQSHQWLIWKLVTTRNLITPIKPSWLRAINKWVARNPHGAKAELEEARFEWVISHIIEQRKHKDINHHAPIAVLGYVFQNYLMTNHSMKPIDINIAMSHVLTKTEVTISDLLWAEHYYVSRATKQLSLLDNA